VNDATGLVLYRFAVVAALTGTFSVGHAVLSFGGLALGGIALGLVFGWLVEALLTRMRDPTLSVIISFLAAWVSYIAGDWLHVSGVLTTVACGVVMGGRQHSVLSAATRSQAGAVWEVVGFVLESLIFILIGLSLRSVLQRLGGDWHAIATLGPAVWIIIATVILSRFVWILPATYIPRFLSPSLRRRDPYPPLSIPVVMSWAGMRGVVSLAAALALPEGFPGRDFILLTTFAVILVTVLVQGATLAPLIRTLRLGSFTQRHAETLTEDQARARMAAAQLAAVEKLSAKEDQTQRHPRLLEQYGYRARATARFSEAAETLSEHRREHFQVVLAAVAAGRAEILRLHHAGSIHDRVLATLENDLDLEEISARRYLGEH
jgi:monovalent cation/hydrogen antiporter